MIVTFEGGSDDIVCTGIGKSIAKLNRDETYVDSEHRAVFEIATPSPR